MGHRPLANLVHGKGKNAADFLNEAFLTRSLHHHIATAEEIEELQLFMKPKRRPPN